MTDISPFAPASYPEMPVVAGVRLGGAAAGVRYKGRNDLFLALLDEGTTVAGVFTKSKTRSAPVDWCRSVLPGGKLRAVIVNSGNANAFTGRAGVEATERMVKAAAKAAGCKPDEVMIASTGVIGERLPVEKVEAALPGLAASVAPDGWEAATRAIMTTDTFPKAASATITIDGRTITVAGIAKGSGMIAPDMATMLAFVFTDAAVPADVLQSILKKGADRSFNSITVDGDTSTSDTLILAATGKAGNTAPKTAGDPVARKIGKAVDQVLMELATLVVKDGEGAQKFVTIDVTGAASAAAARRIGLAIANSPLVKTAIAGEDANWGRIVMAIGKSGEKADRDRLTVAMGGTVIAEKGEGVTGYDEAPVAAHLKGRDIHIAVDVGVGRSKARVWTCDLTHGYIDINADYRS